MTAQPFVIALDGGSGTGKSSTAKEIARRLGIAYLDTGAMYRSLSVFAREAGIIPGDAAELTEIAGSLSFEFPELGRVVVNGRELTRAIREPETSARVSADCQPAAVRAALVEKQREYGQGRPCVLDGRDIGTVVFPDARFKFFLECSPETRARRRLAEMEQAGMQATYEDVLANLIERDRLDSSREIAPLRAAPDAVRIDTTALTFEEQVECILAAVRAAGVLPAT